MVDDVAGRRDISDVQADTTVLYHPTGEVIFRHWDDDTIVYHRRTCDTYRLDPLSAVLLEAVCEAPRSEAQLQQLVNDTFIVDAPERLSASIRRKLQDLCQLDFIAPGLP